MVVGAKKWNRKVEKRCVQYVGMTRQNCAFRVMQHFDEQRENDDKFQELKLDEIGFWIGVFVPLTKDIKKEAHLLEHALIHCTKPPLNVNATINPAKEDITILSRFYKKRAPDQVCKNQPKTLRNVPDVIMWDGKRYYTADRLKPTENK